MSVLPVRASAVTKGDIPTPKNRKIKEKSRKKKEVKWIISSMYNSLLIVIDYYFIINYDIHNNPLRKRRKNTQQPAWKTNKNKTNKNKIKIKQVKIK